MHRLLSELLFVAAFIHSSAEGVLRKSGMSEHQKASEDNLGHLVPKAQVQAFRPKNLKRRSSIQKIIHVCNQSYHILLPHVFFLAQDFQTSVLADLRRLIPVFKSILALRLGVYLSIALLSAELAYCLIATLSLLTAFGSAFFLFCIAVLIILAFQVFDVALELRKKLRGSFFVKKKKVN